MVQKIGMREFRNNLARYLNASSPVAILRHGQTIGYFIPTRAQPEQAELEGLKRSAARLDLLLQEQGIDEDKLVAEFRQLREREQ